MVKVVVVVVWLDLFYVCVMVFIVGCVDCVFVIEGNLVSGGVVGVVMLLIMIVFIDLLYVYFDIDEVMYFNVVSCLWFVVGVGGKVLLFV